jgi:16S rRNA (uracil1498-N3)-methyltransferase
MPSFYLSTIDSERTIYEMSGEEAHHLNQVMRKREGDTIQLTSGDGVLAEAVILESEKRHLVIEIISSRHIKQSTPRMALGFALLKNKHDSLIIEKATELGCSSFYPLLTTRTVRSNSENLTDKFKKTAIAAIKQCDNAWCPLIKDCLTLEEQINQIRRDGFLPVAALETKPGVNLYDIWQKHPGQDMCLIIGPEGGFCEEEMEFFRKEKVDTFSLGNHILRAETAAIAAIAQLTGFNFSKDSQYY